MKCMLSMSVFSHLRRLRIGEDSLKGDDIGGFIFCFTVILLLQCIRARLFLAKHGVLLVFFFLPKLLMVVDHAMVINISSGLPEIRNMGFAK